MASLASDIPEPSHPASCLPPPSNSKNATACGHYRHPRQRSSPAPPSPPLLPTSRSPERKPAELGEQDGPIFGPRRYAGVELVHRRLLHRLCGRGAHLFHPRKDLGVPSIALERGRDEHELTYGLGMLDRRSQGDPAAERV